MTRQILFKKEKNKDAPAESNKSQKQVENKPASEIKVSSKSLYDWLGSHELINLNGACKKVGYDRGNFVKAMGSNKDLPASTLTKFVNLFKEYGYAGV